MLRPKISQHWLSLHTAVFVGLSTSSGYGTSRMHMSASSETPPSYDDAMCTSSVPASSASHLPDMTNAELLCRIDAGVQLYYITPEGYVSAPSYPTCLSIYLLTARPDEAASATNCETPPAFLQVGDWIYPLLPGQSPVLQSNWGSYIFPDVSSSVPGNVYTSSSLVVL